MKIVCISDTHTFHAKVSVPPGDILIHAGDLALSGSRLEVQDGLDWLNSLPHREIVLTPGNHDWAFARRAPLNLGRVHCLENFSTVLHGLKFYGAPQTPWFLDWAFNVPRGAAIKRYWDAIPDDTDVLITHGPPLGFLDQTAAHLGTEHLGCEELRTRIEEIKPKLHCFGHIHGGYGQANLHGTQLVNASVVNEAYRVVNKPIIIEL